MGSEMCIRDSTGTEAASSSSDKDKRNKRDPMLPPASFWLDEGDAAPAAMGQIAGSHLNFAGEFTKFSFPLISRVGTTSNRSSPTSEESYLSYKFLDLAKK